MATRKQDDSWGRGVPEKRIMMMAVAVAVVMGAAATLTKANGLTCVEHRGRCVREELLAHEVVRLDHALDVCLLGKSGLDEVAQIEGMPRLVDAHSHTHKEMLIRCETFETEMR